MAAAANAPKPAFLLLLAMATIAQPIVVCAMDDGSQSVEATQPTIVYTEPAPLSSTPTPMAPGDTAIGAVFRDDFESGLYATGKWTTITDYDGTNGLDFWGMVYPILNSACHAHAGAAVWCAENGNAGLCGSCYANYMNAWMITRPLTLHWPGPLAWDRLTLYFINESEACCDYFDYSVSVDGTHFYGYRHYGTTSGYPNEWQLATIDLSNVPGLGDVSVAPQLWVALHFSSDLSLRCRSEGAGGGAYVDDITVTGRGLVDVGEHPDLRELSLGVPSPNPARGPVGFELTLPRPRHIRVQVLDFAGRVVRSLADRSAESGRHQFSWDGRDDGGAPSGPGLYFVQVRAGAEARSRRVVLLR